VYRLVVDPAVVEQTQALPDDALPAYAEFDLILEEQQEVHLLHLDWIA